MNKNKKQNRVSRPLIVMCEFAIIAALQCFLISSVAEAFLFGKQVELGGPGGGADGLSVECLCAREGG